MDIGAGTEREGVVERPFTAGEIPGVLWTPDGATGARPLVLLAHGGGQHKRAPGIEARAHGFVRRLGFAAVAVDVAGHGDRRDGVRRTSEEMAQLAVPEWRQVLDGLQQLDDVGAAPVGFWGVSLGGHVGLRLLAAEPRVTAAVIGLVGSSTLFADAEKVTVPVQFVVQWDDEMVPRAAALALFDALGSRDKTLHAYPGPHRALPRFAVTASEDFLARHLRP